MTRHYFLIYANNEKVKELKESEYIRLLTHNRPHRLLAISDWGFWLQRTGKRACSIFLSKKQQQEIKRILKQKEKSDNEQ